MSAKGFWRQAFRQAFGIDEITLTRQELQTLLDRHAHELAEKLRDRYSGTCGCGCDCPEAIDPEVSDSGV